MRPRLEKDFTAPEDDEEYTIPTKYQELDEIAAPSPVEEQDSRFLTLEDIDRRHSAASTTTRQPYRRSSRYLPDERPMGLYKRQRQSDDEEKASKITDDYEGLNELATPAPVDVRHSRSHDDLESRISQSERSHMSQEEDRTKIADTARIPSSGRDNNGPTLMPSSNSSAEVQHEKQPPSTPNQRSKGSKVSKFATELYTVSYLVFFSFLGTLARLGLQALTFYPGAPTVTGVLW